MNKKTTLFSTCLAALLVAAAMPAAAQHAAAQHAEPNAEQSGHRRGGHEAMQAREFRNLQQGRGMGMARVAEINGYPGPMHVLEHAEALELADAQLEATRELVTRVKTRAPELGKQIVDAEKKLEAMFVEGAAEAEKMNPLLSEIAELRAQLRSLHLSAHLDQAAVLNETQLDKYKELRSAAQSDGERRPMRRMRDMKREGPSGGDNG